MKYTVDRDEWWPVYWPCSVNDTEPGTEIPKDLLARYYAAETAFMEVQEEFGELYRKDNAKEKQ